MKHNRRYNSFGWLSALTLMLTTACTSMNDFDLSKVENAGENIITLTVKPQTQTVSTRGTDNTAQTTSDSHISDGSKVDVLIYAVYESSDDKDYTLVTDSKVAKGNTISGSTFEAGTGQTIVEWEEGSVEKTITLILESEKVYKVAFWAQNSTTNAYNTSDLTAVKVNYKNDNGTEMLNNDELRDAFCANVDIKTKNATKTVTLYRPLAQINVGTTGWDYEGAAHLHPSPVSYTQSEITLKGVAQYYDVLGKTESGEYNPNGITLVDNTHPLYPDEVVFKLNTLPAFINFTEDVQRKPNIERYDNEEMLVVDLNKTDDGIQPYVTWDEYKAALDEHEQTENLEKFELPKTEVFKYLSMCYVLVPEAHTFTDADEKKPNESATYGAVLDYVTLKAYGIDPDAEDASQEDEPVATDEGDGTEEVIPGLGKVFEVNNVPVQKNWRTNILGNNFFVDRKFWTLDIVPEYMGNYTDSTTVGSWPLEADPQEGGTYYAIDFGNGNRGTYSSKKDDEKASSFFVNEGNKEIEAYQSNRYGSWTYTSERTGNHSYNNGTGFKLNKAACLSFTTDSLANVVIVFSEKTMTKSKDLKSSIMPNSLQNSVRGISFDGKDYPIDENHKNPNGSQGVYVYTIKGVEPGKHYIRQGTTTTTEFWEDYYETGLFYVEVIYGVAQPADETVHPDNTVIGKYPDYNNPYYNEGESKE